MRSRHDLISAYVKRIGSSDETDFWAWEEVQGVVSQGSDEAVALVLDIVDACQTDEQLGYVGAGPVEDLLNGRTFPAFARASRGSAKVRRALKGVYLAETEDGYEQWKALLEEYGMWRRSDT